MELIDDMTVLKIEYLNSKKKFQKDEEVFEGETWEEANDKATQWGIKNLDNFSMDMIKFVS